MENLQARQPARTWRKIQIAFQAATEGRRLGVVGEGYLALLPGEGRVGDEVTVLRGGYVPFLVRRGRVGEGVALVGECYVFGIMDGEVMGMGRREEDIIFV